MMQKNFLILLSLLLFSGLFSCSVEPESPAALLKQKKDEMMALKTEIKDLEKSISASDTTTKKIKRVSVSLDSVRVQDYSEFVEVQGQIQTKGDYMITAEMPGNITALNIKEGQYVRRGQLMGSVDSRTLMNQISELQLQLDLARDLFDRRKNLWEQNIGSELEFLTAKNQVESLESSRSSLETELSKANFYAPSNGVIQTVHTKQGELVSPGMPIASLIDVSNVQIEADISEIYLPFIKKGDEIDVNIPALELDTKAWISNIGALINPANRTFKIEAEVSNRSGMLKPNLLSMIKIKKFGEKESIVIPTQILQKENQTDFVYILAKQGEEHMAVKKIVEAGRSANGTTQILSGLEGNEVLIDEGKSLVKNGSFVNIVE